MGYVDSETGAYIFDYQYKCRVCRCSVGFDDQETDEYVCDLCGKFVCKECQITCTCGETGCKSCMVQDPDLGWFCDTGNNKKFADSECWQDAVATLKERG